MQRLDLVAARKIKQGDASITLKDPEESSYLKKALEKNKKKQLKDLILKHKDELGLKRFYLHTMREQKEMMRQQKQKQKQQMIQQILEEKPSEGEQKKQVRIDETGEQAQQHKPVKTILKKKQKIIEQISG